jgi:hypothetical protein
MINLLGVTRKNYVVSLEHGQATTGSISVARRSVSIAPYGTSEAVSVPEVTKAEGAIAAFPKAE